MNAITALLQTDFGNPDGLYDHNLENYFFDNEYWKKIVEEPAYFIIGRKGTGKSAIYNWIKNREAEKGMIISNLSFKSFPFQKLLKLSDDDFSRPNQYQSIWKYIILSEFGKQIVLDEQNKLLPHYEELYEFVNYRFGKNLRDLHSKITTSTDKTEFGLQFRGIGPKGGKEKSLQFGDEIENITEINERLEDLVLDNLAETQRPYLIQFDQLDDNYTLYIDNKKYFESLISLFKIIYSLNSSLLQYNKNSKVVAYLRSDIFNQFSSHDPDSAKFDFHTYKLNWTIINKNDWTNPALLQLMNIRIENSVEELKGRGSFNYIFNKKFIKLRENGKSIDPFKYLIHRTFHRPRDLVQFCIKIKEQADILNKLDYQTINAAEKEYSSWLIDELKNEISPIIPATDTLFALLRTLGTDTFTSYYFKKKYLETGNKNINKSPEALLRYLYELGIISNIQFGKNGTGLYSIIRNEKSKYDPKMKAVIHSGLIKGLYTY
ncbi:hypothetical protein ABN763_17910 [Spongiivirga sp. MCCC 1A20706]|uniref:P-loop ATPase, Sll1717 family n=1 Tax=Spongiivirga sp. MCCC 1A20706 TaxID=3160963 RepID=UPI003977529F